ncbi:MAG: family 43 glycosylhydrolase [Bryobacteraceae bacterium]
MKKFLLILLASLTSCLGQSSSTFRNPVLRSGPDPWVIFRDGYYYEMNTTGVNLMIRKARNMSDLGHAETKVVWVPPPNTPYSAQLWAPELHFLRGKWYIYFAADSGQNETHRNWVLENASADPLSEQWTFKGQLTDKSNKWAIDPSVFEEEGQFYALWSGWPGKENGTQNIYIAKMENPWQIKGKRVKLSSPHYRWEKYGSENPPFVRVNEGPEILKHDGKLFLVYSASGCWTDQYALGFLVASEGSDLLKPKSWKKSRDPVFTSNPRGGAYSPGHNGFFKSPDGTQDWIIYHANPGPGLGCKNDRSPRIQPFTWKTDGSPDFGQPVDLSQAIPRPSGETVP